MIIIPHSSFTANPAVADFPALKLLFHKDDCTAAGVLGGVVTWVDRVTGLTLTITPDPAVTIFKDAEGVSADDLVTTATTGTMPTVTTSHYAVMVSIGKPTASSSVAGLSFTLGGDASNKLSMSSAGIIRYNSAALNTVPALSPAALTSFNKKTCTVTYADFVDVTGSPVNPRIDRVVANTNYSDAASVTFSSGSTTTTAGAVITPGQFADAFTVGLGTDTQTRHHTMMLFLFTTPITFDELKLAAIEMARTRQPYAGWRNKA